MAANEWIWAFNHQFVCMIRFYKLNWTFDTLKNHSTLSMKIFAEFIQSASFWLVNPLPATSISRIDLLKLQCSLNIYINTCHALNLHSTSHTEQGENVEKATKWTVCLQTCEKNARKLYINTISAFALSSRSLKYTYSLSRVNLQEFCVFTSKSTWIEQNMGIGEIATPEQGYYNVSNVKKKIFLPKKQKNTHSQNTTKKFQQRRTNKKGVFSCKRTSHTHPVWANKFPWSMCFLRL